jgi:hypothetical protein
MSETLIITKNNAIQAYFNADDAMKKVLVNLFGEEILSQKITDRVKTFEDACEVLGVAPEDVLPNSKKTNTAVTAVAKLLVITEVLNEGWKPNWQDSDEYKYMPWFEDKTGVGLSFDGVVDWDTITGIGSRLCYKSNELAEYAAIQFKEIYNDFINF